MTARAGLLLLCLMPLPAQIPTSWTPEFSMRFETIGDVVPSPDAKLVAWVQTRPVMETERSEVVSQIYLGAADGSRRLQLTRGEKSASHPLFSPDSRYVYFLSGRTGKTNVFRIRTDGGEAEQVTQFKGPVSAFGVSPDGKWIAFTGHEPDPDIEKARKEKRDWEVVDENPANAALYIVPAEPDAGHTRTQRKLFENAYHITDFDWSPDSRAVAFTHQPSPSADDWTKSNIAEVTIESGVVRELAATGAAEREPHYSPDGRYLAFTRTSDPPRWPGDSRIVLLPRQGGDLRVLPATYDESPRIAGWRGDSSALYFAETRHTRQTLYEMPLEGPPKTVYEPKRGTLGLSRLNLKGAAIGFAYESPDEPPEAFVMALASPGPGVRVSRANLDLPKLPLGRTEVIRWKSKDGLEVEGLLTYPAGYQPGKKAPLILNIHGGPAGVFVESFIGRHGLYPLAVFSAKGYAILRPNPRGSSGYGKKFRYANVNDWGGMDYQDDQAGVDHVIGMGVADPGRLAVMGWSYGGFMTSWTITQTHRFKAAAIGAGVTDLLSFTGTADIPGFLPDYFEGDPWKAPENYRKHSPITYVGNVTTPALILHGAADLRVPVSQGYEYYNALKRRGVTTKMIVYPRQPHGPREPKFLLDIMRRHLDWVDKYVR